MICLIDGDLVAYRCAASAENDPLHIATYRADELINRIVVETGSDSYRTFLTGERNYRLDYNPEYKANRKDTPRPKWLQELREHLVVSHGASVSDGNEADDEMAIAQCADINNTIIASLDKDLLQIPGKHFSWEIRGTSVKGLEWVKPSIFREVSGLDGLRHFYYQLLMGDRTDNIFGFDGVAREKVPKFLEGDVAYLMSLETELDMYNFILEKYGDHVLMHMNAHCLYIQKKTGDRWQIPFSSSEAT